MEILRKRTDCDVTASLKADASSGEADIPLVALIASLAVLEMYSEK